MRVDIGVRTKIHIADLLRRAMAPGTYNHVAVLSCGLCLAVMTHAYVAIQRPLAEDIEPAAQRINRNRYLLEDILGVDRLPVVVVIGVVNPLFVEARVPAQKLRHIDERKMPKHRIVAEAFRTAGQVVLTRVLHDARLLPDRTPSIVKRQTPGAVERYPVMVEAGGSDLGKDSHQVRRRSHRRPPLDMTQVRSALHADLAVRPRLPGGPFHGVVTVLD